MNLEFNTSEYIEKLKKSKGYFYTFIDDAKTLEFYGATIREKKNHTNFNAFCLINHTEMYSTGHKF